jgi:hypothetical protein
MQLGREGRLGRRDPGWAKLEIWAGEKDGFCFFISFSFSTHTKQKQKKPKQRKHSQTFI